MLEYSIRVQGSGSDSDDNFPDWRIAIVDSALGSGTRPQDRDRALQLASNGNTVLIKRSCVDGVVETTGAGNSVTSVRNLLARGCSVGRARTQLTFGIRNLASLFGFALG